MGRIRNWQCDAAKLQVTHGCRVESEAGGTRAMIDHLLYIILIQRDPYCPDLPLVDLIWSRANSILWFLADIARTANGFLYEVVNNQASRGSVARAMHVTRKQPRLTSLANGFLYEAGNNQASGGSVARVMHVTRNQPRLTSLNSCNDC
jgi:hypothetical protein